MKGIIEEFRGIWLCCIDSIFVIKFYTKRLRKESRGKRKEKVKTKSREKFKKEKKSNQMLEKEKRK